jgi:hypothetical protein
LDRVRLRLGTHARPQTARAYVIVIAGHQPPLQRRTPHARQGLDKDAIAGFNVIEHIVGDQNMTGALLYGHFRDPVDHVQTGFGQGSTYLVWKAPERLAELPVSRVDDFDHQPSIPNTCSTTISNNPLLDFLKLILALDVGV